MASRRDPGRRAAPAFADAVPAGSGPRHITERPTDPVGRSSWVGTGVVSLVRVRRRSARLRTARPGLAVLGTGLVHGPRGAFLRLVLADAAVLVRVLDVLVLTLALGAPCLLWHRECPPGRKGAPPTAGLL